MTKKTNLSRRSSRPAALLGLLLGLALSSGQAFAGAEPLGNPLYRYDEHTPSAGTMRSTRRAYRYRAAFEYCKVAACWADKLAQHSDARRILEDEPLPEYGDEYYDPAKWDFENIVRYETRLMFQLASGRVEAGELVIIEDDE